MTTEKPLPQVDEDVLLAVAEKARHMLAELELEPALKRLVGDAARRAYVAGYVDGFDSGYSLGYVDRA